MKFLKINQIEPNPNQPRRLIDKESLQELAESIKTDGLFNPITVRPLGKDKYQIVHGERRWQASRKAGLKEIEVKIINVDDEKAFVLGLVENLQRKDLTPYEEMQSFKKLIDEGWAQEEIAKTINKTQSYVAQKLRLAKLPLTVLILLKDKTLSEGGARQILRINGIINKYERVPFIEWKYGGKPPVNPDPEKCWFAYHWAEFYQDQIAWHSYKESVAVIKDKVDLLRFNYWYASLTSMPTEEEEKKWFKQRKYPTPKLIKKDINPRIKKEHEYNETVWGVKYAHEHGLFDDSEEYVT